MAITNSCGLSREVGVGRLEVHVKRVRVRSKVLLERGYGHEGLV